MVKINKSLKLVSWNVNGIRSCLSKGMSKYVDEHNPDILCLQEIKAEHEIMEKIAKDHFPQYTLFNSSALKKGYSGVSTLVKKDICEIIGEHSTRIYSKPDSDIKDYSEFFENEGRFSITRSQYFTLFNVYIPSGTSGEERQALKYIFLDNFMTALKKELSLDMPVVLCGDFNICHKPIDIHHPKIAEQRQLTGFLPQERAWLDKLIEAGFIDCYRKIHGDIQNIYTWWSYRAGSRPKNLGWRIDYFFCNKLMSNRLKEADIHSQIKGSDHCPISVVFDLN